MPSFGRKGVSGKSGRLHRPIADRQRGRRSDVRFVAARSVAAGPCIALRLSPQPHTRVRTGTTACAVLDASALWAFGTTVRFLISSSRNVAPDCEARRRDIDRRRCSTTDHATSNHAAKRCRAIDAASAASYDEPSLEKFDKFAKRNDRNVPRATCCTLFPAMPHAAILSGTCPDSASQTPRIRSHRPRKLKP